MDEPDESEALERMLEMAKLRETTARALLSVAWVADGLSALELTALDGLARLSLEGADMAETLLSMAWVADGLSPGELAALYELARLSRERADMAETLLSMAWVADGVSDKEADALSALAFFVSPRNGAPPAESVIALTLTWIADGVSDSELEAARWLSEISRTDADIAETLLGMAWVADGVSDSEADYLSALAFFVSPRNGAPPAESVIALTLTWAADGVSDSELEAARSLSEISRTDGEISRERADIAETLLSMRWISDGVSDSEAGVIAAFMERGNADMAETLLSMRWIADGVSDSDLEAVRRLSDISQTDADAAARVADMPFLQTLERSDITALGSLSRLPADQLADMLSHPLLKGGITDREAPTASLLSNMVIRVIRGLVTNPDMVDRLRSPHATVERRSVELPLAGEVELAIFRTRPGSTRSMDLLENAVREAESLMGKPLPFTRNVGLVYGDTAGGSGGQFQSTHIVIRPELEWSTHVLAHEVAHYYWSHVGSDWINEGMAELMASAIENRRVGKPVSFINSPCRFARSLKELEELAPKRDEPEFSCNYSLGEGLFVSLLRALGEDAFWEGARKLYAAHCGDSYWDSEESLYRRPFRSDLGIDQVRQAFGADANEVIARWYDGR